MEVELGLLLKPEKRKTNNGSIHVVFVSAPWMHWNGSHFGAESAHKRQSQCVDVRQRKGRKDFFFFFFFVFFLIKLFSKVTMKIGRFCGPEALLSTNWAEL